jgi:hypothetical protein
MPETGIEESEELQQEVSYEEISLDEEDKQFVDNLIDRLIILCNELLPEGDTLRPYQVEFARRIFESLIVDDGATMTGCFARQSGKSETLALVTVVSCIFFPRLSKVFPHWLGKYRNGFWVGAFAPVDEQADNLFGRINERVQSDRAKVLMTDPAIDEFIVARGRILKFQQSGSLVRKTTCHPKATIEGRTYHLILIDEAQGADKVVVDKKIAPMGAATNASMVMTGTPAYNKGVFYDTIRDNKRSEARGAKRNNFEYDWKSVAKHNLQYRKKIEGPYGEKNRLGEDSDEFRLSYKIQWILEKGMFTTSERLDSLGDISMQSVVHAYHRTPIVAGIDVGRKQDKTIVTAVYVDWDNPDPFGLYYHQILNWLDLEGMDWEEQYFRMTEFLSNYNVWKVGIDVGGLGDVVAQRMQILMPHVEVIALGSANTDQSERWKYLKQLLDHGQISWPAGAKVRRNKTYKRFRQEMEDLEIHFKGPYVLAEAPKASDAHDDYPDSLSMACILSHLENDEDSGSVEVSSNILYGRSQRAGSGYLHTLR